MAVHRDRSREELIDHVQIPGVLPDLGDLAMADVEDDVLGSKTQFRL
jgi:hypothetical protein